MLLITVVLLFIAKGISLQEDRCIPEIACENGEAGNKVPDPDNCNQYYLCVTNDDGDIFPTENPLVCPTSQFFDLDTGNCTNDTGTPCRDQCLNNCTVECKNAGDLVVYPGNCQMYYVCNSFLDKIEATCSPELPYFNGSSCDTDPLHCCDNCIPYCDEAFVQIVNPSVCTQYYICTSVGLADESTLNSCREGEYFDTTEARCVLYDEDQDPCEPLCPPTPPVLPIMDKFVSKLRTN